MMWSSTSEKELMLPNFRSWIGSGLLAIGVATAQTTYAQEPPALPTSVDTQGTGPGPGIQAPLSAPVDRPPMFWAGADYLLWWTKAAPVPTPLLTTGSAADPVPGGLGQPGTSVLFGGGGVGYGTFSGVSVNAGVVLDPDLPFALEGSLLVLGNRSPSFTASSNDAGFPVLARPLVSPFGKGEYVQATSLPGLFAGTTTISTALNFQAWEFNLAMNVMSTDRSRLTLLAGFRQLNLNESLTVTDVLTPLVPGSLDYLGKPIAAGTLSDFDHFHTSNNFYGGQIGGRYTYQASKFNFDLTGKIAFGGTNQLTTIDGATALAPPGAQPASAPGGILAQPTNIGSRSLNTFSVVPEVNLALSYQVTPWLQARVGYSFLYWTNVIRPGNTVDRTVNVTQTPSDIAYGTLPLAPARPLPVANQSDFWAQGVNFGLMFSY